MEGRVGCAAIKLRGGAEQRKNMAKKEEGLLKGGKSQCRRKDCLRGGGGDEARGELATRKIRSVLRGRGAGALR